MQDKAQETIDGVVSAFFSAFDNHGGQLPDFGQLESLFTDRAVICKRDGNQLQQMTVDEFIAPRQAILSDGSLLDFHEWETSAKTILSGGIATRISSYEKKGLFDGQPYSGTGRKHIQLVQTPAGWRINAVLWEDDPS